MGLEQFVISDHNPNEDFGSSGGCACHPHGNQDCTGPFTVFTGVSTDDPNSPIVVVGHECMNAAMKAMRGERQPSPHVVTGTAIELPDEPEV